LPCPRRTAVPAILALSLCLAALAPARGAPAGGDAPPDSTSGALPDSLGAAAQDSLPGGVPADSTGAEGDEPAIPQESLGVHPSFESKAKVHDTRVDLTNDMRLSIAYPNTWIVGGSIHYNRQLPRQIKQEKLNTGFKLNTSKRVIGSVPISLLADRSYSLQEQNKGENNYRRDETEKSGVSMSASGAKEFLPWLAGNLRSSVGVNQSVTKNNQGLSRESSDAPRTLAGHLDFDPVDKFKIVTGYVGSARSGPQQLMDTTDDVETTSDSLQVRVSYKPGSRFSIDLSGGQLENSSERLDFLRDQYNLIVTVGDEDSIVVKELTEERKWGGRLDLNFTPWDRFSLKGSVTSQQDEKRVSNSQGRLSNKDRDGDKLNWNLSLLIKPWTGQQLDLSYKTSDNRAVDFAADLKSVKRELLVQTKQTLHDGFSLSGEAFFLLNQDFYADPIKNPQDRDQAQTRLSLSLFGVPLSWIKTDNMLQWYESRDILIQSSRSVGSKDRRTLSWRSNLDYNFFRRFKVTQRYEVNVTEEDFIFTQDKNALDREFVLVTASNIPLYGKVLLNFQHEFRKQELGSFLPDPDVAGNPKTFFRESRLKREFLRLGLSYRYREYLLLSCDEELGREVDFSYLDETQTASSFGTLSFSVKCNKKIGDAGNLDFTLLHQARFGKFVRENQRHLWLPSLSMGYTF